MDVQEHLMFFNTCYTSVVQEVNLKNIEKEILEIKNNDQFGNKISNYGGWQSKSINNLKQTENTHMSIFDVSNKILDLSKSVLEIYDINKDLEIKNFWFNINGYKDFNISHRHPGSIFSSVFYVKTNDNSGNLIFERPDSMDDYIETSENNRYRFGSFFVKPENSMCVLFPSHIKHYVEPNLSHEERISIAFNIGYKIA